MCYIEVVWCLGIEFGGFVFVEKVCEVVLDLCRSKGMLFDVVDYDMWSVGLFFVNLFVVLDVVFDGCLNWVVDN